MKKLKSLLLVFVLVLSMTGCQLARTDLESTGDRLVGVVITTDYLDLFDFEAYLNDNLTMMGGDFVVDGDTRDYQGRIYATLEPISLYGEDGEVIESDELHFADIEGIHFITARIEDESGSYNRVYSNEGIINAHTAYKESDTESSVSLEGEIWMVHRPGTISVYINPVYQDGEGNFYVTSGQGFSTNGDNAAGGVYTQTMEESHTVTEGDETKTLSVSIRISVGSMYEPELYRLIQMNEENQILDISEHIPGALPKEMELLKDTAYVLLETHQKNVDGKAAVTRELHGPDSDLLSTFYAGENGFMLESFTTLQWE